MDDDLIVAAQIDANRSICITSLSRETYLDSDAKIFNSDRGFFVVERDDSLDSRGLSVLAKVASLEAAYRFAELLGELTSQRFADIHSAVD